MKRPFSQGEAIWFQEIFPKMVKIVDCIFFRFVNKVSSYFMDLLDKDVMEAKILNAPSKSTTHIRHYFPSAKY